MNAPIQLDEHEQALLKRIRAAARIYFGLEVGTVNSQASTEELFDCLCEWAGIEKEEGGGRC